jgi:guanylate kinase
VCGPGGVGKGTLVSRLVAADPDLWLSRSWTTRPRRPGEPEDAYRFVDRATFDRRVEEGGFLEWAQVLDELYGTPTPEPSPGTDVVLEIDVQGARSVRRRCPSAVVVLVVPPSREVQAARLRARGDSEEQVARRLTLGETEEVEGRALADHVVVNDDLERATADLAGIIHSHRTAAHRGSPPGEQRTEHG